MSRLRVASHTARTFGPGGPADPARSVEVGPRVHREIGCWLCEGERNAMSLDTDHSIRRGGSVTRIAATRIPMEEA